MDAYARALMSTAAAQCASAAGFSQARETALDALTDLGATYCSAVASRAKEAAEHAGRTDVTTVDILYALRDLGSGFEQIEAIAKARNPKPFYWSVPRFPARKRPRGSGSANGGGDGEAARPALRTFYSEDLDPPRHIPGFLPMFPAEHTYAKTEADRGQGPDPHAQWLTLQRQNLDGERALVNLQSRVARAAEESQGVHRPTEAAPDAGPAGGDAAEEGGSDRENGAAEDAAEDAAGVSRALTPAGTLSESDALGIKATVLGAQRGAAFSFGDAAIAAGFKASAGRSGRLHDFESGGWKPPGFQQRMDLDLAQRERLDRAKKILKFGVHAASDEVL